MNVPYQYIPTIGLICNLIVVSGGCWHYYKNNQLNNKLIFPLIFSSAPMAFLGGMIVLKEKVFFTILLISLILSSLRLLFSTHRETDLAAPPKIIPLIIMGSIIGFTAGMVSIGGGIFLTPILLNLGWGKPKEIAATSCIFIFVNSFFGIIGQVTKGVPENLHFYFPLFLAVFLGGQIGSRLSNHDLMSQRKIQIFSAILILFICFNLIYKTLQ